MSKLDGDWDPTERWRDTKATTTKRRWNASWRCAALKGYLRAICDSWHFFFFFTVDARHHSWKLHPASQSLEENAKLKKDWYSKHRSNNLTLMLLLVSCHQEKIHSSAFKTSSLIIPYFYISVLLVDEMCHFALSHRLKIQNNLHKTIKDGIGQGNSSLQ